MRSGLILGFLFFLTVAMLSAGGQSESSAPQNEAVSLRFTSVTGMDEYVDIIADWEIANPDVTIEHEVLPTEQFVTIIRARIASGDVPDVFPYFNNPDDLAYARGGHLVDLSDMTGLLSRFREGVLDSFEVDGGIYALPSQIQYIFAYYNREIFNELELEIPQTWDEFIDVLDTIKAAGITPLVQGTRDQWTTQMIPYTQTPALVDFAYPTFRDDLSSGRTSFADNPGWQEIATRLDQLINGDYFNEGSLSMTYEQSMQAFANGEAAITVNGTWALGTILSLGADFEVGGFRVPTRSASFSGPDAMVASASGGLSVWSGSDHVEEAKQFLAYTLSAENNAFFNATKGPSPLVDVEVDLEPAIVEMLDGIGDMPTSAFPAASQGWSAGVQDALMRGWQEVFAGSATSADVLEAMDDAQRR